MKENETNTVVRGIDRDLLYVLQRVQRPFHYLTPKIGANFCTFLFMSLESDKFVLKQEFYTYIYHSHRLPFCRVWFTQLRLLC